MYPYDKPIIDIDYYSAITYSWTFDYDLFGRHLGFTDRILENPVAYIQQLVDRSKFELMMLPLVCLIFLICGVLAIHIASKIAFWAKVAVIWSARDIEQLRYRMKRKRQNLPPDHDATAENLYKFLTRFYKIHAGNRQLDLPNSAIEYESIRFALEAAWPTGMALYALNQIEDPDASQIELEGIEGQDEDAVGKDIEDFQVKLSSDDTDELEEQKDQAACAALDHKLRWDWYGDRVAELRLGSELLNARQLQEEILSDKERSKLEDSR